MIPVLIIEQISLKLSGWPQAHFYLCFRGSGVWALLNEVICHRPSQAVLKVLVRFTAISRLPRRPIPSS